MSLNDDPMAGYLGYFNTYERISRRYYGHSVYKYVTFFGACQRRKPASSAPAGLLQPLPPPLHPSERLDIELLGPLPLSTLTWRRGLGRH